LISMQPNFIHYDYVHYSSDEQLSRARELFELCNRRRSVRHFSSRAVPKELLETLIRTAGTAPSGANKQPWRFIVVTDPEIKRKIRVAAEKEEKLNYERRMSQEWLDDLAVLGTDWHKEFLETAPALIVVFSVEYEKENGRMHKNYYVKESVGLAVGFLVLAIHNAGLASVTHTPSPMHFLQKILNRPMNERPFVLIPVGYPSENAAVPKLGRKPLDQISVWL
jgi:iodotyrosine deiodinase